MPLKTPMHKYIASDNTAPYSYNTSPRFFFPAFFLKPSKYVGISISRIQSDDSGGCSRSARGHNQLGNCWPRNAAIRTGSFSRTQMKSNVFPRKAMKPLPPIPKQLLTLATASEAKFKAASPPGPTSVLFPGLKGLPSALPDSGQQRLPAP